jgi:hypothetical protein
MSKSRTLFAVLCLLCSVVCVVWAKPKADPKGAGKSKCHHAWAVCDLNCPAGANFAADKCHRDCRIGYGDCMGKLGLSVSPDETPRDDMPQATTTGTPKARHTPGAGFQTSPSATPLRIQPQGTLMQASPSPTPATSLHGTSKPKKN